MGPIAASLMCDWSDASARGVCRRAGTGLARTMKSSVRTMVHPRWHKSAKASGCRRISSRAARRCHHHCHVKDAQDAVRARISQIIVGRFVFQREVNEVPRRTEKCRKSGWARNNCRADGNAQSVDDNMAAACEPAGFIETANDAELRETTRKCLGIGEKS